MMITVLQPPPTVHAINHVLDSLHLSRMFKRYVSVTFHDYDVESIVGSDSIVVITNEELMFSSSMIEDYGNEVNIRLWDLLSILVDRCRMVVLCGGYNMYYIVVERDVLKDLDSGRTVKVEYSYGKYITVTRNMIISRYSYMDRTYTCILVSDYGMVSLIYALYYDDTFRHVQKILSEPIRCTLPFYGPALCYRPLNVVDYPELSRYVSTVVWCSDGKYPAVWRMRNVLCYGVKFDVFPNPALLDFMTMMKMYGDIYTTSLTYVL